LRLFRNIEEYTKDMNLVVMKENKLIRDAVIRNLEVIGEAVKNIPKTVKDKYPQIEWREIAGLRDILAHRYFEVDLEIIGDIIKNKLPGLKDKVSVILK